MGQSLYVMGSIQQLGNWNDFVCPMQWTDGHIWVTDQLVIDQPVFRYKYVLKEPNDSMIWETGYDRIADLTLVDNLNYMD